MNRRLRDTSASVRLPRQGSSSALTLASRWDARLPASTEFVSSDYEFTQKPMLKGFVVVRLTNTEWSTLGILCLAKYRMPEKGGTTWSRKSAFRHYNFLPSVLSRIAVSADSFKFIKFFSRSLSQALS